MANVNLLSQLAGSVAPTGEQFNPAQVMATGQQLQANNAKMMALQEKIAMQRDEQFRRAKAQEILQRASQSGYGAAGREILPLDPELGMNLMELQASEDERMAEDQRRAQTMAAIEAYAAQNGLDPAILAADPEGAIGTIQGNLLGGSDVSKQLKVGANGNFWQYNPKSGALEDTGVKAKDDSFGGGMVLPDGTEVFFGSGGYTAKQGNVPIDKKIGRDIQDQELKDNIMLADLFELGKAYTDGFFGSLTWAGKGMNWLAEKVDRTGAEFEWSKDRLERRTTFRQGIEQVFNAYRKEITGAAASVQELERLMKAMMNVDLSPTEFTTSYNNFIGKILRGQKIAAEMARMGYDASDDKNAQMFDRLWNIGTFGDAERINYLGLMQNINEGLVNQDDKGNVYASDGEKWIRIKDAE